MELLGGLPRVPKTSTSKSLKKTPLELWLALKTTTSRRELAGLLDVPYEHLAYLLFRMPTHLRYEVFSVGRKGGRPRLVSSPNSSLKILQRKVLQTIELSYSPPTMVHGFVAGRSIVTNAAVHLNKRSILSIDIENFFGTINFGRVRGLFLKAPFDLVPEVATALAQLTTFENALPQGAPTSPLLSNLICRSLDRDLAKLSRRSGSDVTRFADDIVFSTSKAEFDELLVQSVGEDGKPHLGSALVGAIERSGFALNDAKSRLARRGRRQVVTGVVVGEGLSPRGQIVREVRTKLHLWASRGRTAAEDYLKKQASVRHRKPGAKLPGLEKSIEGGLSYWSMVAGSHNSRLRRALLDYKLLCPASLVLKHRRSFEERVLASLVVIEGDTKQGTGFSLLGVGVVTCAHVLEASSHMYRSGDQATKFPIKVRAISEEWDLAVLECPLPIPVSLESDYHWPAEIGSRIFAAGFPNQNFGDTGVIHQGAVAGYRNADAGRVLLVGSGATIVFGQSGGPALNTLGKVIGVCVRGAADDDEAANTEAHSVVPIARLAQVLGSS